MSSKDQGDRGFKIPKGYFEGIEDKVLNRLSKDQRRGFKVPDGYFENFAVETDVISRKSKVLPIDKSIKARIFWMAAAASILLIFGLKYSNLNQSEPSWSSLDQNELSFWIENDLSDVSAYDIAEVYQDVELEVPLPADSELKEYLSEIELEEIIVEN